MEALGSKELIQLLFSSNKLPRIPVMPLVFSHACRLEQISVRRMLTDAGQLSKCLQNARELYGYDAIICPFDLTLEAEACGCAIQWKNNYELPFISSHLSWEDNVERTDFSDLAQKGRIPIVLEALRRIKEVLGKNFPVAAGIAGPLTLAERLSNIDIPAGFQQNPHAMEKLLNFAANASLSLCKAFCEIQPDMIFIIDNHLHRLESQYLSFAYSLFKPLLKVIRFYNAYAILISKSEKGGAMDTLLELKFDGLVTKAENAELSHLRESVHEKNMVFGNGIPIELLNSSEAETAKFLKRCFRGGRSERTFLTTEWEVPVETEAENILRLMKLILSRS